MVVRDYDGQVAAALSKLILQPLGPLEIEAKAMEISVSFAWDVGIRDMVVESDSKIVSDALLGLFTSPITVSNILTSLVHQLWDFRSAEVSHVERQGNRPAHLLAKHAKELDSFYNYVIWIEKNSSLIKSAISHDVTSS